MERIKVFPSVMCINWLRVEEEIKELEKAGVDGFHFDIMDGRFVPNFTMGPRIIKAIRKISSLPFDVHLMISHPEEWLLRMKEAGADILTIHVETCPHLHRALKYIKSLGVKPCVALNPATPPDTLEYILGEVKGVLVMTVDPGFAGQEMVPFALEKIKKVKKIMEKKNPSCWLGVDGNVSFEKAPHLVKAGANVLVAGTSSLFSRKFSFLGGVKKLRGEK